LKVERLSILLSLSLGRFCNKERKTVTIGALWVVAYLEFTWTVKLLYMCTEKEDFIKRRETRGYFSRHSQ